VELCISFVQEYSLAPFAPLLSYDFRSLPAAGVDFGDVVLGEGKTGHPGQEIFELALGVENLEADPVSAPGIVLKTPYPPSGWPAGESAPSNSQATAS
jgi:hypothetical protein